MRLKLPLFICLVSLVGSAFAAAPADSGDARLRDTLRSTLQQLNTAEADRAALQSAQAESDRQVKELTAQLAAAVKRSAADKVAAEKALDAVAVRLAMREHEIERLQRAQAEAKAAKTADHPDGAGEPEPLAPDAEAPPPAKRSRRKPAATPAPDATPEPAPPSEPPATE